ncbi:sensor histidine kinase [Allorhizocola rhizosphaerae]|uniref:sensor histidine kinase n=1 Tax=Allorhizocola rhizosphaerae TaxID=1872709 RepID=UPI000E3C0612|nr:histidine kinase [Allorhizocola rhizosphaerae]
MRKSTRSLLFDVLLALLLMVIGLIGSYFAVRGQSDRLPLDALGGALIVVAAGALVARRRRPVVVLAIVTLAVSLYLLMGYPFGPALFPAAVAMYAVASRLPMRQSLIACGVALVVLFGHAYRLVFDQGLDSLVWTLPWAAWLLLPWAMGVTIPLVRATRAEQRRERIYGERLRVAREVHDVMAHGLAAINMQAQVALHVLERRPEQARLALEAIHRSSRDALDELRGTLAVFRAPDSDDGDERRPSATLAQLDRLVSRMTGSGLSVRVEVAGERPADLASNVDLAGYRIVQEALTNVLRHAGQGAAAHVRVSYQPETLELRVTDNGSKKPTASATKGHGITGMMERAAGLGGTLSAGPRPEGGFEVVARLPLRRGTG